MSSEGIATLFASILGPLSGIISSLKGAGIVINRGVTVYYKRSEIEYRFHISLPPMNSRFEELRRRLGSLDLVKVDINGVLDLWGFGLMMNEDLKALNLIKLEHETATIDFPSIVRSVKSELLVLSVRTRLPDEIKRSLLVIHISQNSIHVGKDLAHGYTDVVLDYGNLWHETFESFTIRDVEFTFNLQILEATIEQALPSALKKRIKQAAHAAQSGDNAAIKFFEILNSNFAKFQDEKTLQELKTMFAFDPPFGVEISSVASKMELYGVPGTNQTIILPSMLTFKISLDFEANLIADKRTYRIVMNALNHAVASTVAEIIQETKSMVIPLVGDMEANA